MRNSVRNAAFFLALLTPAGPVFAASCASAAPSATAAGPATLPTGDSGEFRQRMMCWDGHAQAAAWPTPSASAAVSQTAVRQLTSRFGARPDPFDRHPAFHAGVDIAGAAGTPIRATADGIVARAARAGSYGELVVLEHGGGAGGLETRYAHLSRIMVRPGQPVRRGDVIALMGSTGHSTGPHLHYEVRLGGRPVDPLLPARWTNQAAGDDTATVPHISAFALERGASTVPAAQGR